MLNKSKIHEVLLWAVLVAAVALIFATVPAKATASKAQEPTSCQRVYKLPPLLRHPRVPSIVLGYTRPVGLELSKCLLAQS